MSSGVIQNATVTEHSLLVHQEMTLEITHFALEASYTVYQFCAVMLLGSPGQNLSQRVKNTIQIYAGPHFNLFIGKRWGSKIKWTIQTFMNDIYVIIYVCKRYHLSWEICGY